MSLKRVGKGFEFAENKQRFKQFERTAPKVIANNSLNHFLQSFRKGGHQTDASKSGWQPRKPRKGEYGMQRRTLIKTGALRRDLKILKAVFGTIILGTSRIKYALRHNEGLAGMPKSEFIGDSKELNRSNEKLLIRMLNKVMKI